MKLATLARIHRFIEVDGVRTAEGCEGVTGAIVRACIRAGGRSPGGLRWAGGGGGKMRTEDTEGTAGGPWWREFEGTSVVRWAGRWQTSAVRLGVEWLGAGPGRGRTSPATASSVADAR